MTNILGPSNQRVTRSKGEEVIKSKRETQ